MVRIKLPLLFIPLAFAGVWTFSKREWMFIGAAASFVFDNGLEVQYGVFLYTFLACLCWKLRTTFNDEEKFSQQMAV